MGWERQLSATQQRQLALQVAECQGSLEEPKEPECEMPGCFLWIQKQALSSHEAHVSTEN